MRDIPSPACYCRLGTERGSGESREGLGTRTGGRQREEREEREERRPGAGRAGRKCDLAGWRGGRRCSRGREMLELTGGSYLSYLRKVKLLIDKVVTAFRQN